MTTTPRGLSRFTMALALMLAFGGAASVSRAQYDEAIVTGIQIEGLERTNEQAVSNLIRHEVGSPLDRTMADEDLIQIFSMLGMYRTEPTLSYWEAVPTGDGNGVLLVYHLTENPAVTGVTVMGNSLVPTEKILEAVSKFLIIGEIYKTSAEEQVARAVQTAYEDAGYAAELATAPDLDPETGMVTLSVLEYYIYDIEIEGLDKTKRKVVERELKQQIGDPFCLDDLQRDLNRLWNLDLFEAVDPRYEPGPERGDIIIIIGITEKKTGVLSLGVGYSNRDGILGFAEYQEKNLGGMGRRLSGRIEYGSVHLYDITFYEPWLGGDHTSLEVSVYDRTLNVDRSSLSGVTSGTTYEGLGEESRRGLSITASRPIGDEETNWILAGYRYERIVNEDPRLVSIIAPALRQGVVGSLKVRWSRDTRDLVMDPTEGARFDVEVEHADRWLGSEHLFTRFDVDVKKLISVGDEGVIALRGSYGTVSGNAPIFETYGLGGADTLRGYREDRWFGTNRVLGQVEFRKYLGGGDDKKDVQLVAFLDIGSAFGGQWAAADGTIYRAEDRSFTPHIGYGIGVRVTTALGPIRLDVGLDDRGAPRTHFGLYQTF